MVVLRTPNFRKLSRSMNKNTRTGLRVYGVTSARNLKIRSL